MLNITVKTKLFLFRISLLFSIGLLVLTFTLKQGAWLWLGIASVLFLMVFARRFRLTRKDEELQEKLILEDKMPAQKPASSETEAPAEPPAKFSPPTLDRKRKVLNIKQASQVFRQADTLLTRGLQEEAKKLLIQILSLDEKHEEALLRLGLVYLGEGDLTKAEAMLRRLIEIKEKADYLKHLGQVYRQRKEFHKAVPLYEKIIVLEPRQGEYFYELATLYLDLEQPEKAVPHLEEAVKKSPREQAYLTRLAAELENLNQLERALTFWQKLSYLDPYNEKIKAKIAELEKQIAEK